MIDKVGVPMKLFQHVLTVFALACLSNSASAGLIEATFDVTFTSKEDYWYRDGISGGLGNTLAQPISFTTSVRFELDNPPTQTLEQPPIGVAGASISFQPLHVYFTYTPFTNALFVSSPAVATWEDQAGVSYGLSQVSQAGNADQAVPVLEQMYLARGHSWQVTGMDGAGTTTTQAYMRGIAFQVDGSPMSSNQFTQLTGEDTLAFLQTQVGVVHSQAFFEFKEHSVFDPTVPYDRPFRSIEGTEYLGDVVLRSVTAVPEPGALMLSLSGIALVGLHAGRKRRAIAASEG